MKNNKGFSLVELIIVIAIMAILVGVMAPQLIKYIEKSKVSADTQLADSVHTAVLTAMMDPEIVNKSTYNSEYATYVSGVDATSFETDAGTIGSGALEILGVSSGEALVSSIKSTTTASPVINVRITGTNKVSVWIDGTDASGSKGNNSDASSVIKVD